MGRYTPTVNEHRLRLSHHVAYLAVRGYLAAGGLLPLVFMRAAGQTVASIAARVGGRDLKRAKAHIRIAFPEFSDTDRAALLSASARHLGRVLGEVAWLRHASPLQVDSLCDISGEQHLFAALEQGRGAILVTGHIGNWELLGARLCTAGIPMSTVVRRVYDPRLDQIMTDLRSRFGTEVIHRGPRAGQKLLRALLRNRVLGLLIDQDIRDLAGTFVPFFGRPSWTPTGAATMAIRAERPIVPTFIHRQPDGRHIVEAQPPLPFPDSGTTEEKVHELTAAATAAIEQQIRKHPEQWVWMHRRWRTEPEVAQKISAGRGP